MHPPASDSACAGGQECWAVTYREKQCGCEHRGECQGCHNRKRRDITRPSGGTEADGAGMRLNYPCGIWLRHQGSLSSFPRQREEAIRAARAVCILFIKIGANSSSERRGLGEKRYFSSFPGFSPLAWSTLSEDRG